MTSLLLDESLQTSPLIKRVIRLIAEGNLSEAHQALQKTLDAGEPLETAFEGLLYSLLGMLHRLQKNPKMAWRCYDQAEKKLPSDPALKLISAELLLEVFGQAKTVIQKLNPLADALTAHPLWIHKINSVLGLAYLKKGDKNSAVKTLEKMMEGNFEGLGSAANIDLRLLEALLRKKYAERTCLLYLETGRHFAEKNQEAKVLQTFTQLVALLAQTLPSASE